MKKDAAFIAAAREWIPALCDRVEGLEKDQAAKYLAIVRQKEQLAAKDAEISTLRRALELAVNKIGCDSCRECDQSCQFCVLSDAEYFIQQAQEEK